MLQRILILLTVGQIGLTLEEQIGCARSKAFFEISGDAVLSVFLDMNYGPYCNVPSESGSQELSAALYAVQTLNKYDFIPDVGLGLKVFDTCRDEMTVYKQALHAVVDLDCVEYHDLGVLLSSSYNAVLEPFRNYSVLPIGTYEEQNLTKPLISVMVDYLSRRFEVVDLAFAETDCILNSFVEETRKAGVCVKNYMDRTEESFYAGDKGKIVIAAVGSGGNIRRWIKEAEEVGGGLRKTWVILPLDRSNVDDLVPLGSYIVKAEHLELNITQGYPSTNDSSESAGNSIVHSPDLLGIGKAIVELARVLGEIRETSCSDASNCPMPRFNPDLRREISNSDVYDALRVPQNSRWLKYSVLTKTPEELLEIASYRVDAVNFRATLQDDMPKMPRLCVGEWIEECGGCVNFINVYEKSTADVTISRSPLKASNWVAVFLAVVVCGTLVCIAVIVFIVYRIVTEKMLEGEPSLTIVLALANIFTLQSALPFCMDDDYFGSDYLNSRKIFLSTLAFAVLFSVMLCKALFLALSSSGVFGIHINGYLQGLLAFFMSGVQIGVSTLYFVISPGDPGMVVRSLTFIGLLGYDASLLATLFAVCCFVVQARQNYREERCLYGTVIGLLIAWAIWVGCFVLMEPEARDIAVSSGILSTALLVVGGILVPKTYSMIAYRPKEKDLGCRFDPVDPNFGSGMNTITRQLRPYCDYIYSTPGADNTLQISAVYPNYYGGSSPGKKYFSRCGSPDSRRMSGRDNYNFPSEMKEINHPYVPRHRSCVENIYSPQNVTRRSHNESVYARPSSSRKQNMIVEEAECVVTEVYVAERVTPLRKRRDEIYPSRSPTPRLNQSEATIPEEEEYHSTMRITRF